MRTSLRRSLLLAPAAALFLMLLELLRTAMAVTHGGLSSSWPEIATRVLPVWATLVLASPWCALMAARFPFRARRLTRATLAHLAGAAVFVLLHMMLIAVWGHLFTIVGFQDPHHTFGRMYVLHATLEFSVYVGIVVFLLLLDARRESAERAVAAARLEQGLAAARLQSLQAQIQPHFLFNTLNTLAVLARRGDGDAVDRALVDLGELMRASFDASGRHESRLSEELEFLERYVGLQRLRFPGRLEVEWHIDDDTRAAMVPTLLVQPLVENALEHGLATVQGGRVAVSARRDGDTLEIVVSDDGPGFRGGEGKGDGIGLANTRERLALLYGTRGTLTCGDRAGGGGEVRLRLPWRVGEPPGSPA